MRGSPLNASGFLSIRGRGSAPGLACGPLRRNRQELNPGDISGCVLLAERAVPDDIGRMLASAGTLTLSGALLSHVSLLSREFGKPSVSLDGTAGARLTRKDEVGLLVLERTVLDEGDVVFLDGSLGVLTVPGGPDREARRAIRGLHGPLAAFGKLPDDDALLRRLVAVTSETGGLDVVLEAAFTFRLVPPGAPARRLLEALREAAAGSELEASLESVRARTHAQAESRCEAAVLSLEAAEDLEDLQRGLRLLERALDLDLKLIEDLGGDPDRLENGLERVLAAAASRRLELEAELRRQVNDAVNLSDASLRGRVGGLFRLLRRARSADIDPSQVGRLHRRLARQLAEERARAGTHLVVPIGAGAQHDRGLVGGKAHALLEAEPALPDGCRIPRGFVVTSAAYSLHLLGETADKLRLAIDEVDEKAISRKARAAILAGDVPDDVREAIKASCDALGARRLAVRSSATIEDGPLGSLAGLFDSYLGVAGVDDLVSRVRWAWASLWNARAIVALASLGLSPARARQAVLVQEMIETRAAGVLFSRDPAGRSDTLLINATWGLGEGISQGELAGDLYWVQRSTGKVIAAETGRAASRIELAPQGFGTVEAPLPPELRGHACLTPAELMRLAALARALEDATGRAQDVEFGFDGDGDLFVFQMRRIVPRRPAA